MHRAQVTLSAGPERPSRFRERMYSPADVSGELWSYFGFVVFRMPSQQVDYAGLAEVLAEKLAGHGQFWRWMKIYVLAKLTRRFWVVGGEEDRERPVPRLRLCLFSLGQVVLRMIKFRDAGNQVKCVENCFSLDEPA